MLIHVGPSRRLGGLFITGRDEPHGYGAVRCGDDLGHCGSLVRIESYAVKSFPMGSFKRLDDAGRVGLNDPAKTPGDGTGGGDGVV